MPEPDAFRRDWAGLPELPLEEVLQGLLPCIRSLYAFAATCRAWRRLLRASAADLVRPRVPPLLLLLGPNLRLQPFSPLVAPQSIPVPFPAEGYTLLSASRGYLILLRRDSISLHLVDALTGTERRAFQLSSPDLPYHYAALSPSHLLLFHSDHSNHAFFSLPFPENPSGPAGWTEHALPRAASFVTTVLEFSGRVLGLTDRAQILEFHLDTAPLHHTVTMLPAAGIPDAATFDRSRLGTNLVAAGDRLLLVLFMIEQEFPLYYRLTKMAVYALDLGQMVCEEVDDIGAHTLFVDCAGRSAAVSCVDVGSCGVEENRVYVALPHCHTWERAVAPGSEGPLYGDWGRWCSAEPMARPPWPSLVSVHPPLFF